MSGALLFIAAVFFALFLYVVLLPLFGAVFGSIAYWAAKQFHSVLNRQTGKAGHLGR